MRFPSIIALALSLFSLGILSSPVPDSVDGSAQEARSITVPNAQFVKRDDTSNLYDVPVPVESSPTKRAPDKMSERDASPDKLFTRSTQNCAIIGEDVVNCRSGPGTNYPITHYVFKGTRYAFTCYKSGTCFNGNCTWDREKTTGCYVSGYYTDGSCTAARLGLC